MTTAAMRTTTSPGVATGPSPAGAVAVPPVGPGVLEPLRALPGVAHALLIETDGGTGRGGRRVLAEVGADEGTADAVLAWARHAGAVAVERELALDDLIVTSDVAYHLLRALGGPPARGPWVYLRVHRDGGNLALARRSLARLGGRASATTTRPASAPGPTPTPGRATAPVPPLPSPRRPTAPAALPAGPTPPADREPDPPGDSAGVLGQRWRTDPETLRRVLAGLLRLGRAPRSAGAAGPAPTTTRSTGATPTGGTHE